MKLIHTCLILVSLLTCSELHAEGKPKPIVILVSIDGCRWDYLKTFAPPTLTELAASGVRAERMLSCFPSKTFPNHYSIVTGLRPESHGIIGNDMYDPTFAAVFNLRNGAAGDSRWWGGEPIWVTAAKHGLRSACMFWPGSEAKIGGYRPDLWNRYDWKMTSADRVQGVLNWLQLPVDQRPSLITLYFDIVDGAGHNFGPDSPEVAAALNEVDAALTKLVAGIESIGLTDQVNYIVVSDHGMAPISTQQRIALDDYVNPKSVQIDFNSTNMGLRPLDGDMENLYAKFAGAHPHFQAYRREDIPAELHFTHNLRIPPVVLIADPGWLIYTRADYHKQDETGWGNGGAHGYDPTTPDMGATFIAAGPAFKSGVVVPAFENIQVYDLICTLLGIQPAPNEGDHRLAYQLLKP